MLFVVWLFVAPRTVACQTPLSMGFFRQEYRYSLKVTALSVTLSWIIQAEAGATQAEMAEKLAQQVGNLKGWDVCEVWGNSLEKEHKNISKGGSRESQGTLVSQGPPSPADPHCAGTGRGRHFHSSQLQRGSRVPPSCPLKLQDTQGVRQRDKAPSRPRRNTNTHVPFLAAITYNPGEPRARQLFRLTWEQGRGEELRVPFLFFSFLSKNVYWSCLRLLCWFLPYRR